MGVFVLKTDVLIIDANTKKLFVLIESGFHITKLAKSTLRKKFNIQKILSIARLSL